ncbi:hypothetical protein CXB51_034717 [Gossypium anomalum]|uniref:Uncharacterized protein n=1 Tax=Gossypium anomalum TaxID=47600 RepID=A0A8J5Y8A5_9ROSI|nr:hypothetical protein CXB51_034717 [Gossypium anomalum]
MEDPAHNANPDKIAKVAELKKKCKEYNFTCHGHTLNTLPDRLYDLYISKQSLVEIWKALEEKYNTERQEDFTMEKILRHLRIEEKTQKRDTVYLPQSSKVNHVSESKKSRNGKRKATSDTKDVQDKKKKSHNCYNYKERALH